MIKTSHLSPTGLAILHAKNHPTDEHSQQVALFATLPTLYPKWPELRWAHAIPNGEERTKRAGVRLQMEGVKAGICDIFLPIARQGYGGLYIEMKGAKGRVSPKQKDFIAHALSEGFDAHVCYSYKEAIKLIELYMEDE